MNDLLWSGVILEFIVSSDSLIERVKYAMRKLESRGRGDRLRWRSMMDLQKSEPPKQYANGRISQTFPETVSGGCITTHMADDFMHGKKPPSIKPQTRT